MSKSLIDEVMEKNKTIKEKGEELKKELLEGVKDAINRSEENLLERIEDDFHIHKFNASGNHALIMLREDWEKIKGEVHARKYDERGF